MKNAIKPITIIPILAAILLVGCKSKQIEYHLVGKLETFADERIDSIFAQMDNIQDGLLFEMKWDEKTQKDYLRLADTLLYVVEHCDDPSLRVTARMFAYEMEGLLSEMGLSSFMSEVSIAMAEVPYRWTVETQKDDSLIMEIEVPLWTEDSEWLNMEITYFKERKLPPMLALYIPQGVMPDSNYFKLLFMDSTEDDFDNAVRHTIGWGDTRHVADKDYCFVTFPLVTFLDNLEDSDAIIIQYRADNIGVMHTTKVFEERYSGFLREYCK